MKVRYEKKFNNDKRRDMVVGKVVVHLCPTLIIRKKKFNNDKRRDMEEGKVVAHLCLALLIILRFSVEHDRVVTTLNLIKH